MVHWVFSGLSAFAFSSLVMFMMSASVECQMDLATNSSALSSLITTHLEHTIDNLSSFTNIISMLGGVGGLG